MRRKVTDWNTGEKTSWPAPAPVKNEDNSVKESHVTDWNTGQSTVWQLPCSVGDSNE